MADFLYTLHSTNSLSIDPLPEIHVIVEELEQFDNHGCISHEHFHGWLCRYVQTSESLTSFHQVFKNLDDSGSYSVATPDLICALMPFCPGSKSDKLTMAFSLFSTDSADADEVLSIRSLWQVLKSFVAGISIVVKFPIPSRDVAVNTVSKITSFYKKLKFISLEDLSNWYSFCGEEISFWFELLDRKKWPSARTASISSPGSISTDSDAGSLNNSESRGSQSSTSSATVRAASSKSSDASAYSVATTPSSRENIICSRVIIKIAMKLGTFNKDFDSVWSTGVSGKLSMATCRELMQRTLMTDNDFSGRFAAFLYQDCEQRSFGSAAVALSMLFDGSKTSKLRRFFELMHQDPHDSSINNNDGNLYISSAALYELLETIYRTIHFLSRRPYVNNNADRKAFSTIVNNLTSSKSNLVSFSDFGDWYNERGFNSIAWLELLNAKKLCFY